MKMRFCIPIVLAAFCVAFTSCEPVVEEQPTAVVSKYLDLPEQSFSYNSTFPDNYIQLGRVLFYDRRLSANNTISCASCHKQAFAFGDNVPLSKGFEGGFTLRNTMQLVDTRLTARIATSPTTPPMLGGFFWDGRSGSMPDAVIQPILNHIEMGMTDMQIVANKIRATPYYPELMSMTFGEQRELQVQDIQMALTAFIGAMVSTNTRFQQSEKRLLQLTTSEELGKQLFIQKYDCASCHEGQLGVNKPPQYNQVAGFANIGLKDIYDKGLYDHTRRSEDVGKFRIPNLNNVALTAPYMHDGSLATLEDVMDHYSESIQPHANLDLRLRESNGTPMRMNISAEEKTAIIDFLKTFTCEDITRDPRFSNPFVRSAR